MIRLKKLIEPWHMQHAEEYIVCYMFNNVHIGPIFYILHL